MRGESAVTRTGRAGGDGSEEGRRWESGRTASRRSGRITISPHRDGDQSRHQSLPATTCRYLRWFRPWPSILLALQVGVVVLLAIFLKSVAARSGLGRVRFRCGVALATTLQLFEILLSRFVA